MATRLSALELSSDEWNVVEDAIKALPGSTASAPSRPAVAPTSSDVEERMKELETRMIAQFAAHISDLHKQQSEQVAVLRKQLAQINIQVNTYLESILELQQEKITLLRQVGALAQERNKALQEQELTNVQLQSAQKENAELLRQIADIKSVRDKALQDHGSAKTELQAMTKDFQAFREARNQESRALLRERNQAVEEQMVTHARLIRANSERNV